MLGFPPFAAALVVPRIARLVVVCGNIDAALELLGHTDDAVHVVAQPKRVDGRADSIGMRTRANPNVDAVRVIRLEHGTHIVGNRNPKGDIAADNAYLRLDAFG